MKKILILITMIMLMAASVSALYAEKLCYEFEWGNACLNETGWTGVPGLTPYTNATPITLTGTIFGLMSCMNTQVLAYNTSISNWECQAKDATGGGTVTSVSGDGEYVTGTITGSGTFGFNETILNATILAVAPTYTENSKYLTLGGTVFGFDESVLNTTIDARDSNETTAVDNIRNFACGGSDKVSSFSATALPVCTTDSNTLYDSDEIYIKETANQFDFDETKLNNTIQRNLVTTFYNATAVGVIRGTGDGSLLNSIQTYNSRTYNATELGPGSGAPGFDVRVNFSGVVTFNQLIIRYKTLAGENHPTFVQIWSYTESEWEDYGTLGESTGFTILTSPIFDADEHISGGLVQIRFYIPTTGSASHMHFYDWVAISDGFATPSGTEVDPFAIHTDAINTTQLKYVDVLSINMSWLTSVFPTLADVTNLNTTIQANSAQLIVHNSSIGDLKVTDILIGNALSDTNDTANINALNIIGLGNSLSNTNDSVNSNAAQLIVHNSSIGDLKVTDILISNALSDTNDTANINTLNIAALGNSLSNTNNTVNANTASITFNDGKFTDYWNTSTVLAVPLISSSYMEYTGGNESTGTHKINITQHYPNGCKSGWNATGLYFIC